MPIGRLNPTIEYYRHRAVIAEKELEKLRTESGIDAYKAKCDVEVQAKNRQIERLSAQEEKLQERTRSLEATLRDTKQQLRESEKGGRAKDAIISNRDKSIQKLTGQLDQIARELETTKIALETANKEKEKLRAEVEVLTANLNQKTAQTNRNSTNSSKPSSQDPNHGKIINNSREHTGRKPGAQPNHEHWGRKRLDPTRIQTVPMPREVEESPDRYRKISKQIIKQLQDLSFEVTVTDYVADVYVDKETGKEIHGEFPAGIKDEVTYGPGVRAMVCFLSQYCNMSLDKTNESISNITNGKLEPSKGWCETVIQEFAFMTEDDRTAAFNNLLKAHAMHIDNTCIRLNGCLYTVTVCASGPNVLYYFRLHKGHTAIKGTPAEIAHCILIHDHDVSFYSYGYAHQECLAHICRYLKDSIQNEPDLKWNMEMLAHVRAMLEEAKQCDQHFSDERINELEKEYYRILDEGKKEYEQRGGPRSGYRDGFNLCVRMEEYGDAHLLFLRDPDVAPNNNLSETMLRVVKRKVHQVTTFRSVEGIISYCQIGSFFACTKRSGQNIFNAIRERYGDMFADSCESCTNEEYRQWMQTKKRDIENLMHQERRNMEIDARTIALNTAKSSMNSGSRNAVSQLRAAVRDYKSVQTELKTCNDLSDRAKACTYMTKTKKETIETVRKKLELVDKLILSQDRARKREAVLAKCEEVLAKIRSLQKPAVQAIENLTQELETQKSKRESLESTLKEAQEHDREGQIKQTSEYIQRADSTIHRLTVELKEDNGWLKTVEDAIQEAEASVQEVQSRLEESLVYVVKMEQELALAQARCIAAEQPSFRKKAG